MGKNPNATYPKIIAETKLKKYERGKGGKLTLKFDKLHVGADQRDVLDMLVDKEAAVKVTIESKDSFLPGT